jgi:hypothetical protein
VSNKRPALCILDSPSLLNPRLSKLFNGVCHNIQTRTLVSLNIVVDFAEVIVRLDHLIEAVYERFKDRYFLDESMHPSLFFHTCF